MDFHSLSRKELQILCKKNKIPANITNLAMADALAALPQVEGLDEFLNPTEGDGGSGTPVIHPRTAPRSSKVGSQVRRGSRAKNVEFEEDSNVNVLPVTPAVIPPSSRRRVLPVSTRRKKEEDENVDDKNVALLQTPAAFPSSRSRATGRTPRGGTTSVVNTRRSVRLLEKNLSNMSLLDTEDMEPANIDHAFSEQEFSNVSQQTQDSAGIQKEETGELEVSSLEKNTEDEECQSHDPGSDIQLVSGAENYVGTGLQADPQEEGLGKVNSLEAEPQDSNLKLEGISETGDVSNEVGECCDDLVVDMKKSIAIGETVREEDDNEAGSELLSEPENKDCLETKQDTLSAESSEDAFMEFTEQDVAALSVEVPDDASIEVADQCVTGLVPVLSASGDSLKLGELVEWNTDNQDKNNETADGNYIQNFEPMFDGDKKAADGKDLASPEGVLGEHQEEELKDKSEHSEDSRAEIEKINNASDVTGASFTDFAVEKDASFEYSTGVHEAEDLDDNSEKLEAKPEDSEQHALDVSDASSAVLAVEMDATFKNSTTVIESCFESSADKSIMDAGNVTLESSLLDVGVHEAEGLKDNSEILESKAQAEETGLDNSEEHGAEETGLDAASAFSSVLSGISNPQIHRQISVESTGNSIDSSSSDALVSVLSCNSNTLVDGDVISEEIAIPKQESSVFAETLAVAPIHEQKISDIPIQSIVADQLKGESLFPAQSETKGFANEIETDPKMINTEDNMHNVNVMKENLTTDDLENKSIRELKKMLKNLTLDGKSSCKSMTNNVVKEVEKKRTALQALPENRMTNKEAQNDG